jgi:glycosyltransferase involved in cell wall biosynthesis
MRIHHVTPHFHPQVGGLEESVKRFARWQAERGNDVVVHTLAFTSTWNPLPFSDRIDGVTIRRYPPMARRGYYRTWFLPDLRSADLIHLHGYAARTNDHVARTSSSTPRVYSLLHGVRMPHPFWSQRFLRRGYDYLIGLPTLRSVERIVVPSGVDVPWLTHHGVSEAKIRVIPVPLSQEDYIAGDPSIGRRLAATDRFLLYIGRLHREKGVADLLEAFSRLPNESGLVFAGPDGGMLSSLRERAVSLGLSGRVRFLGIVSEEEKRGLLAASTCLALPSFHESQGLAIFEAWAQRRPVVATRVGALVESVSDGVDGLLVPYGNPSALAIALTRLWNNEEEAQAMGERGYAKAEGYRLQRVAPLLQALYDEINPPSH